MVVKVGPNDVIQRTRNFHHLQEVTINQQPQNVGGMEDITEHIDKYYTPFSRLPKQNKIGLTHLQAPFKAVQAHHEGPPLLFLG